MVGKGTSPSRHFVTLDGPKLLTMGSKWAHFTCLCAPNGLVIILEKRVFNPFLTYFWSPKSPFSRLFGNFGGSKQATMGSKWAKNTCLSTRSGLGTNSIAFGKSTSQRIYPKQHTP